MKIEFQLSGVNEAVQDWEALDARFEDTAPLLVELGTWWAKEVIPRYFDDGGHPRWKPRSAVARAISGGGRTMDVSGRLRASVDVMRRMSDEVTVSSTVPYAEAVSVDRYNASGSAVPGVRVPGRPFIVMDDREVDEFAERVADEVFGVD